MQTSPRYLVDFGEHGSLLNPRQPPPPATHQGAAPDRQPLLTAVPSTDSHSVQTDDKLLTTTTTTTTIAAAGVESTTTANDHHQVFSDCDTIRLTRCYFNVRSKADISQLNLPHGTDN